MYNILRQKTVLTLQEQVYGGEVLRFFFFQRFINIFYSAMSISKVIVDKLLVYHNKCNFTKMLWGTSAFSAQVS